MYRKLCFLSSFILVFALSGAVQALTPLDVNNGSFEWKADGNQVTCHMGLGNTPDVDVLGWESSSLPPPLSTGWAGVDVNCGAPGMCADCRDWIVHHDGNAHCYIDSGVWAYQILDHNIAAGRRYDLVYDGLIWEAASHDIIRPQFYYLLDPCEHDVNHVPIATADHTIICYERPSGRTDWVYDNKLTFVAQSGQSYINQLLGIKFISPAAGSWVWVERVRAYSQWASQAYNPNPDDGAVEVPKDANLTWSPGLWAKDVNGHDVYFGSTWAEVNSATTASNEFQGAQSPNDFDPGTMVLGDTYYWRIDEVNENYDPCVDPVPYPPNGRWKGEIWSFSVEGRAKNPKPPSASNDVPRNVVLRWTRGAESLYHYVYFGSTSAEVTAATTSSPEYKTRLNKGTEQYDAGTNEGPEVGEQYFWRIDETNSITVKGNTWNFTVANYVLIDDFDFYDTASTLRGTWKDSLSGMAGGAEVWVNKDANFAVGDGNSMRFCYWNTSLPYYSETMRSYSSGQDWSYTGNGVTCLEIDWFGDINSVPDPPMYVKLSDGSTTTQVNPGDSGYGPNDVTSESQHTWNIPLADFSGVSLTGVTKITLGIGDKVGEGGKPYENGTLYFDDIRLRPPRCFDKYKPKGDFTSDCRVDANDLKIIVNDWCKTGGWFPAAMPSTTPIVEYLFEEGSGTTVDNTGSYGATHDLVIGRGVDSNKAYVTDPNNDPCWFNDSDPCRGWTLWFDGNTGTNIATGEEGGTDTGDYLIVPALNLNSNTVTFTAWIKPDPWLIDAGKGLYEQKESFSGLFHTRDGDSVGGASYGYGGGWVYNGEFAYEWNGISNTWQFKSNIFIPEWQWSLYALVIEPDGATLYLKDANNVADPNDDVLRTANHVYDLPTDEWNGLATIAADGDIINGSRGARNWRGQMDAVRVYDVALGPGEILGLAEMEGTVYVKLNSDADLCVGDKDPCYPNVDDQIDNCDWAKFADEWLETKLWPPAP